MSETAKQWYVVRTIGGKENKVKEYIESEIRHSHLEEYISQVLIPTEKVYTIRNGKKVSKEKVSYPGYVLIEAAFVGQIPIIIRNIPNVLGFLGDTKEDSRKMIATPLRPQEVSRILGRVDELSSMEEENEIPFFVGETIKVTDGPFSSFQGTIEARIFHKLLDKHSLLFPVFDIHFQVLSLFLGKHGLHGHYSVPQHMVLLPA